MNTNSQASAFLALAVMLGSPSALSADTASDAAQVKLQASSMVEVKALAQKTGGYKPTDVEISSTAHQMTIAIINGKLNTAGIVEREAEATRMVTAIARAIVGKTEFSLLSVIHVDYVSRQGKKIKPVQRTDFYKSPAGVFVLHKT